MQSCRNDGIVFFTTLHNKNGGVMNMTDKNNFKRNGKMLVRFETPEERAGIIRILEEQRGFRISEKLKQSGVISPFDTRTFDLDLKLKTYTYSIQPFIGAAMCSGGVRFYTASEFFRIAELDFKKVPRFLVFHVPHDGQRFPEELMASVCVPEEVFMAFHEKMRDTEIGKIVPADYRTQTMYYHFDVSRLLCDVERFIGPEEIMEQYGMGFCYERAFDGTVIKRVTDELKEKTREYYWEHHRRVDRICERNARVLVFDLHSFSDEIVPRRFWREGIPSPDLCIGADDRFTPPALVEAVRNRFSEAGYSIAINYPYQGTYVPNSVLSGESPCDCISVMLEINKRVYFGQDGRPDPAKMETIRNIVQRIINDCVVL